MAKHEVHSRSGQCVRLWKLLAQSSPNVWLLSHQNLASLGNRGQGYFGQLTDYIRQIEDTLKLQMYNIFETEIGPGVKGQNSRFLKQRPNA